MGIEQGGGQQGGGPVGGPGGPPAMQTETETANRNKKTTNGKIFFIIGLKMLYKCKKNMNGFE